MALVDMVMPKMGESIMECTVIHWLKQPGERIEADDSILEVATDKVDTEVPATHAGILKECLVQEGDVVPVGAPIARIETEASVSTESAAPVAPADSAPAPVAPNLEEEHEPAVLEVAQGLESSIASMRSRPDLADGPSFAGRFYSPLVLSIAKEEGIGREELDRIPGTGAENRLTKKDILGYLENRSAEVASAAPVPAPSAAPTPVSPAPATPAPVAKSPATVSLNGQADIIQMDRMRKMIAQRMVESKQISPHVSSFVEVDMTPIVQWRARLKDEFKRKTGENLTFTPILIEALVKAIKDFPMINVSVDGDNIIVKKAINIGMAVALPSGNLIVPVIHDADSYNLVGLTKKVNDLSKRARENKLTADDLANGTYTMSNIGTFGNIMGTPIIVQPQVAIMAFGAIVKKPAVIETPQGDLIGIRQLMFLSHSYDHRVVDGSLGGQFVKRVADYLEGFDTDQKI
ncbi:2-oxo acid dehydrogenase subunit E2 [Rudanella paleaurantiibacter]|uniref:Dihydrolipoamide acetyltransferase component of pyruvate dehydrogenase complex n=1 Tax=Rudanella paleaurantiibacter TaxID=2614655 RepID=A0A7J5TVH4_9BACT|nr:dihydrolipoamide acetyltransferase family protein [Rudanella paleaurantiibacter]KAB7727923.1 2-oxo acid dehydrogenase subunit E2 [Rudanella paleaurantiibacter]